MKSTITAVSPYGLTHVDVSAQVAYDIIFFYILLYLSCIIIKTLVVLVTVFLRNSIKQFFFKKILDLLKVLTLIFALQFSTSLCDSMLFGSL